MLFYTVQRMFHGARPDKEQVPKSAKFQPTHVFKGRYVEGEVLRRFLEDLPDGFKNDQITVKNLENGALGLKLPRKLSREEIEAAMKAFDEAEQKRHLNDDP